MVNGNLTKILITTGVGTITAVLSFMGYGIINNDVRNTEQHISIRKEMIQGDLMTAERIDKVKDIVTEIRLEQVEQKTLLRNIESKL